MESSKGHRIRARSSVIEAPKSVEDVTRMARTVQRKVRREFQERPQVVIAAVAGASFLAGAALGSKMGRILLSTLLPFALQQLVTEKVGSRVASYVAQWMSDAGANGASAARHVS
jgi:hypothetical protein